MPSSIDQEANGEARVFAMALDEDELVLRIELHHEVGALGVLLFYNLHGESPVCWGELKHRFEQQRANRVLLTH